MTDEYRRTCSKCGKRKRRRIYYQIRDGTRVWFCQECLDDEKAHERAASLVSATEAEPMTKSKFHLVAFRATPDRYNKLIMLAFGHGTTITDVLNQLIDDVPVEEVTMQALILVDDQK